MVWGGLSGCAKRQPRTRFIGDRFTGEDLQRRPAQARSDSQNRGGRGCDVTPQPLIRIPLASQDSAVSRVRIPPASLEPRTDRLFESERRLSQRFEHNPALGDAQP